jgi:hypothetical protein
MQAEIIALRHQLTVLQRSQKPKRLVLNRCDRCASMGRQGKGLFLHWTCAVGRGSYNKATVRPGGEEQ